MIYAVVISRSCGVGVAGLVAMSSNVVRSEGVGEGGGRLEWSVNIFFLE